MKYKAVIFDLDGTAVPNNEYGMPSQKLVDTIHLAHEKVLFAAATGRSPRLARPIIEKLSISQPCVVFGGTMLYDFLNDTILWEKKISQEVVKQIITICKPYKNGIIFGDNDNGIMPHKIKDIVDEHVLYAIDFDEKNAAEIILELESISSIAAHAVHSWTPGLIDIHITHKEGTKKHALIELLKLLHVHEEDVIGIGDSGNDIPLLEHVGLKVAMGNASSELKAIADYVAPTVENDGLAHTIEKFILQTL